MKIITATAGHIEYEADGPPRLLVADVHGGKVTLIIQDHPEDNEAEMLHAAEIFAAARQRFAKTGKHR